MNILIPLAGNNSFKDNTITPLITINHKTVIEHVLDNLHFNDNDNFIFILNEKDCDKFYIDAVLKIVKPNCKIIKVKNKTQGQLCSCLLAIEHIENEEPLLIVNGDQYLFEDVHNIIKKFARNDADGGIITFNSVHPKWSYVLLDKDNMTVLEASEKRPISNNACVGFYYYKSGKDFVDTAKSVIRKGLTVNDNYFVSSTYNEMILRNKNIIAHKISNESFFGLDSEEAIRFFSAKINGVTQ